MQNPDRIRLLHMLDAAKDARSFIQNRSRKDLEDDRMLTLSLVKCIEIIGEAAGRVSTSLQEQLTGIPWPDIIGMRNRLIHAYYDVNLDILWNTITEDLPSLIDTLEALLPPDPESSQTKEL